MSVSSLRASVGELALEHVSFGASCSSDPYLFQINARPTLRPQANFDADRDANDLE